MSDPILLTDEAMHRFIREGYVTVQSALPKSYHDTMYARLEPLEEDGLVGHNNLLPMVPELGELLDEPVVRGALLSILGPDYYLHFHRHDHVNHPEKVQPMTPWHLGDGRLHKDGERHAHYMVDGRRHHATRFAMLFYLPQDTTLDMGPTGIVPGSQYVPRSALDESQRIPLPGDAGTVTIMHFDIAHGRFGANTTDVNRHMVKFLYTRNLDPMASSWNHESSGWTTSPDPLEPIWQYMWDWHRGVAASAPPDSDTDGNDLVERLHGSNVAEAIGAAYTLGNLGSVEPLIEALTSSDEDLRFVAGYGFPPMGAAAVAPLLGLLDGAGTELCVQVADILGDIGPRAFDALPVLIQLCHHGDPRVRQYAIESVGIVGQVASEAPVELVDGLRDDDALVRHHAALAVARFGPKAAALPGIVDALRENLYHGHHHVRGWSIEALQRLGTRDGLDSALRYLMATRWDYAHTSGEPWHYDLQR
ncbi:MAG: phytanoyl-CoA dioxygenase family protein [Gammaproteobacteria bacterium]|nr:phytanoyl-CoA dioxygenase family protein [Gammaproteobacteria bacterium]